MKLTKTSGAAIAATAAAFIMSGAVSNIAQAEAPAEGTKVPCYGVNACKGTSACKTSANACKGQNACKGTGFIKTTKHECKAKGGSLEEKKS